MYTIHKHVHTHTLRQGLSVWAPTIVNPLPGVYLPPTANAMIVEKLLVKKYCGREKEREREGNYKVCTGSSNVQCTRHVVYGRWMSAIWLKINVPFLIHKGGQRTCAQVANKRQCTRVSNIQPLYTYSNFQAPCNAKAKSVECYLHTLMCKSL